MGWTLIACKNCHGEFPAKRKHALYCSTACRVAAHRAREATGGERWAPDKRRRRKGASAEREAATGTGTNPRARGGWY